VVDLCWSIGVGVGGDKRVTRWLTPGQAKRYRSEIERGRRLMELLVDLDEVEIRRLERAAGWGTQKAPSTGGTSVMSRSSVSGEEVQGGEVVRPHDGEVAPVEGGYVTDGEPLGGSDHRAIDRPQRQIVVDLDEFGDTEPIFSGNVLRDEITCSEVPQESHFSLVTESRAEQVDHLGDDQNRDQERTRVGFEELEALAMMVVVCVDVGVERAGIDEKGYRDTSSRRISSIRTETSCEPLLPAAEAISFRRSDPAPR
jgi:hypothetical protein